MRYLADISSFTGLMNANAPVKENKNTYLDSGGSVKAFRALQTACVDLKKAATSVDNKLRDISFYCDYCKGRLGDDTRLEIERMLDKFGLNKSAFRNTFFPIIKAAKGIKVKE